VIRTQTLVNLWSPQGTVAVTLEFDDVAMLATAVLCDNPSQSNLNVIMTRINDGKQLSHTFPPGMGQRLDIPTNQASRFPLTFNSRGQLDGYAFASEFPAP
jgi:hypothetical protein